MKVLVAVDGSSGSLEAVRLAGQLLSPDRDELALYYSPPKLRVQGSAKPTDEVLQRWKSAVTKAVIEKATEQLTHPWGKKLRPIVGTQSPKHGILVAADEIRAELIVVGARGVGHLPLMALGSVGRAVVHGANLPVLVVRSRHGEGSRKPLRALFACDGTATSQYARSTLSKFSWPADSVGRVVTVIESGLLGTVPEWLEEQIRAGGPESEGAGVVSQLDQQRTQAALDVKSWCGDFPDIFQQQEPIILSGHASEQILRTIESENSDLVILGSRGLGLVRRVFVGSTSEHMLTHAPCSVLIVPYHEIP